MQRRTEAGTVTVPIPLHAELKTGTVWLLFDKVGSRGTSSNSSCLAYAPHTAIELEFRRPLDSRTAT
jgi:hypothetical protein